MRHAEDGSFKHRGMRHDRVLHVDRGNPLATTLDYILDSIGEFDVAKLVDSADVPAAPVAIVGELLPGVGHLFAVIQGPRMQISPELTPSCGKSIPFESRIAMSTPVAGRPFLRLRFQRSASVKVPFSVGLSRFMVTSVVSVQPYRWITSAPVSSWKPRISDSGGSVAPESSRVRLRSGRSPLARI